MELIQRTLDPLLQSLPEGFSEYGIVIFLAAVLAVLLPVAWYQRRIIGVLVTGRAPTGPRFPEPLEIDLSACPAPSASAGNRRIVVEGLPARVRLVVLAPLGTVSVVEEGQTEEILNNVIWGLGSVAIHDRPQVVVWPPQLSAHGFAAVFHRLTRKQEPDGQPSRWVLLGGPTPPRPRPVLLGLGLWTDEPTTIGRLPMQPSQWFNSLHIQTMGDAATAVPETVPQVAVSRDREATPNNNAPPRPTGLAGAGGPPAYQGDIPQA